MILWREWLENQFGDANQTIGLIWESERELALRCAEREACPINEAFYAEVRKIDESLPFHLQYSQYEKLLDKYNMPSCFYPFPLFKPTDYK